MTISLVRELSSGNKPYEKRGWYAAILKSVKKSVSLSDMASVSIILVDEARIKVLDAYYQKRPRVTDVLSFWYADEREGEIFLCIPQAYLQARRAGITRTREIARLFIHGVLHIAGYDHDMVKKRKVMMTLNDELVRVCAQKKLC